MLGTREPHLRRTVPPDRHRVVMLGRHEQGPLDAAIDSVRAQRLTDWELLIVDDGSNDGSRAVMQRYAALDRNGAWTVQTAVYPQVGRAGNLTPAQQHRARGGER